MAAGEPGGSGANFSGAGALAINDDFGDIHKLVLQGMMSAGILDAKGVKKLFIAACSFLQLPSEERTSMPYVQKVVRDINEKIKRFDMAIRSAVCELTGKKFYIFLITVEKPLMKLQTLFTPFEVGLLQKVIDTIFRKYPSFQVPFTESINLASEVEVRGNLDQAESFLRRMIEMQYLTKYALGGDDFNITMGIRGIRELEPLLRDCYGEYLGNCSLCKCTMLHGLLCPQCRILLHKHCFTRYLKDLKGVSPASCPECSCSWDDKSKMIVRIRDDDFFDDDNPAGSGTPDDGSAPDDSVSMPALSRMTVHDEGQGTSKGRRRARRRIRVSSSDDDSG